MEAILHDIRWVLPLRSPEATAFFLAVTSLGYTSFSLLFLSLGYWIGDKKVFTRIAMLMLATALFNSFLKDFFQDPRPDIALAIDGRVMRSFGFPSGHAQVSVVLWFWLAYEIRRVAAYLFATVLVGLIIFSRLYLGVHDVEDVLAGSLLGAGGFILYRALLSPAFDFWRSFHPSIRIGIVLAVQLAVLASWPHSGPPAGALSTAGFMLSWYAGAAIDRRYIRYQKSEQRWRVAASGLVGAAFVFILLLFEKPRAAAPSVDPAYLAYLKALLLGLFITVFVPLVFQGLRLAKRSGENLADETAG